MSDNHRAQLQRVVFHRSLNRVQLFLGGDRQLMIGCMMVAVQLTFVLSFRFSPWVGGLVGVPFFLIGRHWLQKWAKADPQGYAVFKRHLKYKAYYPARGRFNAELPDVHDF